MSQKMSAGQKPARTCPECGGTEIVGGVSISQTAQTGNIGLSYRTLGILRGTSQFYADVCRKCGTVVRLFVREPEKPWVSKST